MKVKSAPSTAQRLALFRDALNSHYRALRSTSPLARKTPLPSIEQFTGFAKGLARDIFEQEKTKHENALAEIERLKQLSAP